MEEEPGERAKAGPCRDFAIPAADMADLRPITDDDFGLEADVGLEAGVGTPVEEEEDDRGITEEEAHWNI